MNIYRPTTNKVQQLKASNPDYWTITIVHSHQYSEAEIIATLAEVEAVNDEWQKFQAEIWDNVLTDEYGVMGGFDGYATSEHRAIAEALSNANGYIQPSYKYNEQLGWPVRKWQTEIKRTRRDMVKIQKMAASL